MSLKPLQKCATSPLPCDPLTESDFQGCGAEPRCTTRIPSEKVVRRSGSPKACPNRSHIDETFRTTQLPPYYCTRSLVLRRLSDYLCRDSCREGHIVISGQGHCWAVVYGSWSRDRVEFGGICDHVRGSCQYVHFSLLCTPKVPDSLLIGFFKAWATAIHLGHGDNGTGIKLKELAHRAQKPESALSGVRLLWTRFSNRGTDRRARRAVE